MRKMLDPRTGNVYEVIKWFILQNGWEYYVTELDSDGYGWAFVCGFESEFGTFFMGELKPYMMGTIAKGRALNDIAPAIGCEWVEE